MTDKEQTKRLADELDNLVERYRKEYDMTYASVVGVLQIQIHMLCSEPHEPGEHSA